MAATASLSACILAVASALFVSPYVRNVPGSQVWSVVQNSDFLSAVITYSDSNELCQKVEPHLVKVAETYKSMMQFVAVECHTTTEFECTPDREKTLPALTLAYPMGTNFTTGEMQFYRERYTGQMNMKTFGEYLLNKMPFYGFSVDFASMAPFVKAQGFNKTVLFTDKDTIPSLFKALSAQYRDRLRFAVAFKNQTELAHKYNVKFFPTILTFARDKVFEYDGEVNFEDLKWYYSLHAAPTKAEYVTDLPPELTIDQAKAVEAQDYSKTLKNSKRLIVALFHEQEAPKEEWEEIRKTYSGIAQFLQVNCTTAEAKEVADLQGVTTFPAYVLQPVNRALQPVPFNLSAAYTLIEQQFKSEVGAMDRLPNDGLLTLLKSTKKLITVLVADKVSLQYHILASDVYLKSISVFMYSNGKTGHLPGGFPITKIPCVLSLAYVNDGVQVQEYSGSVTDFNQLKYHFEDVMAEFYHNTFRVEEDWSEETIEELLQKSFTKQCGKKTPYCLIALLNGKYEDPSNEETIVLMKKAKAYSESTAKPFRFAWVDAKCEFEFLRSLTLFETQLPLLVFYQGVYNRTFAVLEKPDATKLKLHIDKIAAGRWPSDDTAALALTDRDCEEVHRFYESVTRVPNEYRRKEITDKWLETAEYQHQAGTGSKRTAKAKTEL